MNDLDNKFGLHDSLSDEQVEDLLKSKVQNSNTAQDINYIYATGDKEMDELLRQCIETQRVKGADYTGGSPDKLTNFKEAAIDADVRIEQAWWIFFQKHLKALKTYVKKGQVESEPIEDRIKDLIVYLLLFYKIVKEKQTSKQVSDEEQKKIDEIINSPQMEELKKALLQPRLPPGGVRLK